MSVLENGNVRDSVTKTDGVGAKAVIFICVLFFIGILDRLLFTPFFIPALRADLVYLEFFILLALVLSINLKWVSSNKILISFTGLWLLLTSLATLLSDHFYTSLWRQVEVLLVMAIGAWMSVLIHLNRRFLVSLSVCIVMAFSITAIFEYIEWLKADDPSTVNWAIMLKSYFNIRHFGDLASVATLVAMYFLGPGNPRYLRVLGVLMFFISLTSLIFTGGRASIVAVLALIFLVMFFSRKDIKLTGTLCVLIGLSFVSSYILAAGNADLGPYRLLNSLVGTAFADDSVQPAVYAPATWDAFYNGREVAWRGVIEHINRHPWLGTGPDTYIFILPLLPGQTPHNMILQFALDWGWPATALAMIGLTALLILAIAQVYRLRHQWSLNGFWSAAYIVFFIHGLLASTFYQPADMLVLSVMFGAILSATRKPVFSGTVGSYDKSWLTKAAIGFLILSFLVNTIANYTLILGRRIAKHKDLMELELNMYHWFPFSGMAYFTGVEKLIERRPDKTMYYLTWGENNTEYDAWRFTALKAKYLKIAGEEEKADAALRSALSKVPEVGAFEEWYIRANKETVYQIAGWKPDTVEQSKPLDAQ